MTENECRNKVRCALSDKTGQLRFESFDIVDAPECADTAEKIARYLVGRSLGDVDPGRIRDIGRDGNALCGRVVARMVEESQRTFLHFNGSPEGAAQQMSA